VVYLSAQVNLKTQKMSYVVIKLNFMQKLEIGQFEEAIQIY